MIEEIIRRTCGITAATGIREDAVPDDVAADIQAASERQRRRPESSKQRCDSRSGRDH